MMMKKFLAYIILPISIAILGVTFMPANPIVGAANPKPIDLSQSCSEVGGTGAVCDDSRTVKDVIDVVIKALLGLITVVAVVVIVIAGIKLVTSNGDSGSVSSARSMIIYAVVGIVVAFVAWIVVDEIRKKL